MVDGWLENLGDDPLATLAAWLEEARARGLHEPEAAALATATPDGRPAARMVLVRGIQERELRFYTNHESRKADEIAENPRAALVFHWAPPLHRQARVEGSVTRLTDDESLVYFRTRARESRLGAWASPQSRVVSREDLASAYAAAEERYPDAVPVPDEWGGYVVRPEAVEFWQGRPGRMHDRLRYHRAGDAWLTERLAP